MTGAWIRWLLLSEGLILFLALAGPGSRHSTRRSGEHGLIAGLVIEEPTYLEAVLVNFVALNLFIALLFVAARIVGRKRAHRHRQGP